MWIKLDFTSWFVGGLLIGLLLVGTGILLWWQVPKLRALGIGIAVVGAIPALLGGLGLFGSGTDVDRRRVEVLDEDRTIQGLRLPRSTRVEWYGKHEVLSIAQLIHPLELLGLPLEGELKFANVYSGNNVHMSASLEKATLSADRLIDGVPCKAHQEVEFDLPRAPDPEDGKTPKVTLGKLKRCTPSAPFDFAGNRYRAGSEVTLNGFGGVERGVLAEDQDVDGHWCKGGTEVERPAKDLIGFTLARDETINGIACKAGSAVSLDRMNGRVGSAVMAHDQEVEGIPCRGGDDVGFAHNNGIFALDHCVISRPFTMLNVTWPVGSKLDRLLMDFLIVTVPSGAHPVSIGEVTIVGHCSINLTTKPPKLTSVRALDEQTAYVGFRTGRFTHLSISEDGSGYGSLLAPATVDGFIHKAGDTVRFTLHDGGTLP